MKYMFVADIHGNIEILKQVLLVFQKEEAQKLIFLGDTSASNYADNEEISHILNEMQGQVELIRGNCDNLMLEQRLDTEMYDTDNYYIGDKVITVTHGNRYNRYSLPPYVGNVFIQGHTHIPMLEQDQDRIYANPGSPTYPRGSNLRCYLIVTESEITLKTLEGKLVKQIIFDE